MFIKILKMSENQTQFFIKDSNSRIMSYFKDFLDGEYDYCDLTIVSSEKIELKCHKAVLNSSSSFFKALFIEQFEVSKIILPNYSHDTIYMLLQFLYCGEIFVPVHLVEEFVDICLEFNLDSISEVNSFVQAHKLYFPRSPLQLDNKSALAAYDSETEGTTDKTSTIIIKTEDPLEDIDQIYDEFVVSDDDIIMKESRINEESGDDQQLIKGANEKPLVVHAIQEFDDDYVFDLIEYDNSMEKPEKINYKNPKGIGLNPLYEKMLKRACADVMERGTSYLTASRTYGISRSVIHRHVKKMKDAKMASENANLYGTPAYLHKLRTKTTITEGHRRKDPLFAEKLQSAVNDVLYNGSSFWSAQKKSGITRSVIHRHVQKAKLVMAQNDSTELNPVNINSLREELQDFKERLQRAITTCRNDGISVQEAAKIYDVPEINIERNLHGVRS